ncbi:hypothetical protein [Cellulosimicrobium sp. NPDC057862]|uniref:hypothetical protein n=1 Tax=Actinomycetes TaxID=1760 RepID=UPI003670749E
MTEDLAALPDDELHSRWREHYAKVQEPGCPRAIVLAFDALTDERDRRRAPGLARLRAVADAAAKGPSLIEQQEQRAASEWA